MEFDLPISNARFVVVDVETTGGSSTDNRIMELGFCVVEDGEIVRRYSSLINPHQPIPDFIELMTGITNEMVCTAPGEDLVIQELVHELFLPNTVFVAHNVGFDWGFVASTFLRNNYDVPDIERLCTCRLSRKLSTGLAKHNLGAVAEHYNIRIEARHRALGDADATAQALLAMIDKATQEYESQTVGDVLALQSSQRRKTAASPSKVHKAVQERLLELPDEPGVYYFYNTNKKLLYIGKAKSLKQRVRTYFQGMPTNNKRLSRMIRYIRSVEWETTGTELGALLLESREIKTRNPAYNVAAREYHAPAFLKFTADKFPRLDLVNSIEADGGEYYGPFRSEHMAERIREMLVRQHQLRTCAGDLSPDPAFRPCFAYHIKRCKAPCTGEQSVIAYMSTIVKARDYLGNIENGAITALTTQMEAAAERMDYEHAALLRDGIREIERVTLSKNDKPLAVSDTNLVIVVPTTDRYSTVEVFMLRSGRLVFQRILGTRADLSVLYESVKSLFYSKPLPAISAFTDREIDELRLATSWLYQRRERCSTIVAGRDTHAYVCEQIMRAIRGYHVVDEEGQTTKLEESVTTDVADYPGYNEYSQLDE